MFTVTLPYLPYNVYITTIRSCNLIVISPPYHVSKLMCTLPYFRLCHLILIGSPYQIFPAMCAWQFCRLRRVMVIDSPYHTTLYLVHILLSYHTSDREAWSWWYILPSNLLHSGSLAQSPNSKLRWNCVVCGSGNESDNDSNNECAESGASLDALVSKIPMFVVPESEVHKRWAGWGPG